MGNIRRFFNQNIGRIVLLLGVIAFITLIITFLNSISAQKIQEKTEQERNRIDTSNTVENTSQSIITGQTVNQNTNNANMEFIKKFVDYCNNNQIQEAYSMLTEECKDELYPSIDIFYNGYVKVIFNEKRTASCQSWLTWYPLYVYKVRMTQDIMATGSYDAGNIFEDYITVINSDGKLLLSINRYIYRTRNLNYSNQSNGITVTVTGKDVYLSEEVYQIKVQNTSGKTIKIDSKETGNATYLLNSKGSKILSHIYLLTDNLLILKDQASVNLTIRFNKPLSLEIQSKELVLSDIILDYDTYSQMENKKDYKQRLTIKVAI